MPHTAISVPIATNADSLWRKIGAFGAIGTWHPLLEKVESEGEHEGSRRTAKATDGSRQVERLQEAKPNERRYRYSIESTGMPIKNYVSELRVDDDGAGMSKVTWSGDFDVTGDDPSVVKTIEDFYKAGLDSLKTRYG